MKKILAILLCIVVMLQLPVTVFANDDKKKDDKINAKSVCLMALDTGEVLYAENEYEELSPASVTKIMSLLLVLEALDSGKIKLTDKGIEDAKKSLLKFYKNVKVKPKFMCIIVGYYEAIIQDKDTGIYIVPITALKP